MTSSRRIEERPRSGDGFEFLAGHARADHNPSGEFHCRHLAAFTAVFHGYERAAGSTAPAHALGLLRDAPQNGVLSARGA